MGRHESELRSIPSLDKGLLINCLIICIHLLSPFELVWQLPHWLAGAVQLIKKTTQSGSPFYSAGLNLLNFDDRTGVFQFLLGIRSGILANGRENFAIHGLGQGLCVGQA